MWSVANLTDVSQAAGLGSIGTQILVNGYAAAFFPAWARGSAVGVTLGIGRIGAVVAPTVLIWPIRNGGGSGVCAGWCCKSQSCEESKQHACDQSKHAPSY